MYTCTKAKNSLAGLSRASARRTRLVFRHVCRYLRQSPVQLRFFLSYLFITINTTQSLLTQSIVRHFQTHLSYSCSASFWVTHTCYFSSNLAPPVKIWSLEASLGMNLCQPSFVSEYLMTYKFLSASQEAK